MATEIPITEFAPAERAPIEILHRQAASWEALPPLRTLLNAMPNAVVVLNQHRQIVFASERFLDLSTATARRQPLGLRPGEALGCVHAAEREAGCGTTEFCSQCGAVLAILAGLEGRKSVRECRMLRMAGPRAEALDLRVLATPFECGGERFCVFAVSDISHEKRRRALERAFFHDLLNTAGGLEGMMESLCAEAPDALRPDLELARVGFQDMVEQIHAQRDLAKAEGDELRVTWSRWNSGAVWRELEGLFAKHPLAVDRSIRIDPAAAQSDFTTDRTLLGRVLVNLLKNALEACPPGENVTVGSEREKDGLTFWVHNPGYIPRAIQLQLFNRSFSTKGEGRGLGTYAVKLFAEHYLGGQVGFASTVEQGTIFRVRLPLEPGPEPTHRRVPLPSATGLAGA